MTEELFNERRHDCSVFSEGRVVLQCCCKDDRTRKYCTQQLLTALVSNWTYTCDESMCVRVHL